MRLKVLISAYACEPGKGSEPGVGWKLSTQLAHHCDTWVLTRANNRPAIELELARNPVPNISFVYFDLPKWAMAWKKGGRGVQVYYYLWQLGATKVARRLHKHVGFDVAHHLTFGKYWAPSATAVLRVPSVWGPVGGGDSTPRALLRGLSRSARWHERARETARWIAEHDPLVRATARRASVSLAKTEATASRLRAMGAKDVRVLSEVAFALEDGLDPQMTGSPPGGVAHIRFMSVGNLLGLKGFHLGIRAFAEACTHDTEYWIVGDGPERSSLEKLAHSLGVGDKVRFLGHVDRTEVLKLMAGADALVHPSLHDASGWVCPEAMALGKPVICLDVGGPALQVTKSTGIKVDVVDPQQVVRDLAEAMRALALNHDLRRELGGAGQRRFRMEFNLEAKANALIAFYEVATEVHTRRVGQRRKLE